MQDYIQVLNYAIPAFLLLIGIEFLASRLLKKDVYRGYDTVASLSSGLSNILKDVLGLTVIIVSYSYMVKHLAIFEIKSMAWLVVLTFIIEDLVGYTIHRFEHKINIFWNRHIIHHSSEEFNLACALRQPISGIIGIFFFFYLPAAILGIPTEVIAIVAPLHLFVQFWYHTRLIKKMGFLEHILVTPSHHRVHHAINDEYLDKNFAQVFIIWDKLFGTFQEELDDVPAVYGVKRPSNTWNPIIINFKHLWLMIKDAWRAENWLDKLRVWFMPTGWRPAELMERFPEHSIDDVYSMEKYQSPLSTPLLIWSWIQLFFHFVLMLLFFQNMGSISNGINIAYTFYLFISIFSFTSLMDRTIIALIAESIKFGLGLFIIFSTSSWMNLESIIPFVNQIMTGYLLVSLLLSFYFLYVERQERPDALLVDTTF